jgi:hypothetical protein
MAGRYTGALVRTQYTVKAGQPPPGASDVHTSNPNPPSVYDDALRAPDTDIGAFVVSDSPEVVGSQWLHTIGRGGITDQTNTTDHAVQGPHGADLGAPLSYDQAVRGPYDSTFRSGTDMTQGSDSPMAVSEESIRRGMNSDPINNPEGIPRGRRINWWSDRKIPFPAEREHDQRVTRRALAAQPENQPAMRGPSPYGGSFLDSLKMPFDRLYAQPATRRSPAGQSESMPVSDASSASPAVGARWLA